MTERHRAFRALRRPLYRVVWLTGFVGQLGFWMSFLSLQALMSRLTDADGTWLGLLFFAQFVPTLVFTPFAGIVADRVPRVRILVVSYACLAVVVAVLGVITLAERITPLGLLPFAFAAGSVSAFIAPASSAVVANTVPPDELLSAVSLQSATANLSRVIGPTLAAPILAVWNEGAAFVAYAATTLVVIALLGRVRVPPPAAPDATEPIVARLRSGVRHARERPPAVALLAVLCASSLCAGAYLAMLPVIAEDAFDRGTSGFTTLAAVSGLGSICGALTTGFRVDVPSLRATGLVVAAFGACFASIAAIDAWPLALVVSAAVGGLYFAGMTSISTSLQHLADDDRRGRMMSLFVLGWAGLIPFGGLWQGVVAQQAGIRTAVVLAGCGTAAGSLAVLALTRSRPSTLAR